MELRDFLTLTVAEGGGCTAACREEELLPVRLLTPPPPPSVPPPANSPPPPPPTLPSPKSCDSNNVRSAVEVEVEVELAAGVCGLLPLGMPTRWLWLEWLVRRSFISS